MGRNEHNVCVELQQILSVHIVFLKAYLTKYITATVSYALDTNTNLDVA